MRARQRIVWRDGDRAQGRRWHPLPGQVRGHAGGAGRRAGRRRLAGPHPPVSAALLALPGAEPVTQWYFEQADASYTEKQWVAFSRGLRDFEKIRRCKVDALARPQSWLEEAGA